MKKLLSLSPVQKTVLFVTLFFVYQTAFSQCSITNSFSVPPPLLGSGFAGNGNFNAIVFGNLYANSGDTEGRLAVGGDFISPGSYSVGLAGLGIGSENAPDGDPVNGSDNFIVNGKFQNSGDKWGMKGNFVYNTANVSENLPSFQPSTPIGVYKPGVTNHLNFSALKTFYQEKSQSIAAMTPNGTVTESYGSYTLTGAEGEQENVFEVDLKGNALTGFTFNITVSEGSNIFINIINSGVINISGGSMRINGSNQRYVGSKTLFNFPNATLINVTSFDYIGSVLAPFSDYAANGSSVNGQAVIGGNYTQTNGAEFHNFCYSPNLSPMPVKLVDFKVISVESKPLLTWQTAEETNSERFDIQHSHNAKNWKTIGQVAGSGESEVLTSYQFADHTPFNGANYYRLKMIDLDGTFAYSAIRNTVVKAENGFFIYPNPVTEEFTVSSDREANLKYLSLISPDGKIFSLSAKENKVNLKSFPAGLYVLKVTGDDGAVQTKKLVKK